MDRLSAEDVKQRIAHAAATDLSTGKTQDLVARGYCHFFERFRCGLHDVQLRLDWKDIDARGNPRLDADFYDPLTGKMDTRMRGHLAHHTDSLGDPDIQTYVWEYDDERRHIEISLSWYASGAGYGFSYASGTATAANPPDA